MSDEFDVTINDDGSITQTFHPGAEPWHDFPVPPRVVAGWEIGVVEAEGDKAVVVHVKTTADDPAVLVFDVAVLGTFVQEVLGVLRREF